MDWGTIINSTSVACNYAVGATDYIKANDTNDCADSNAEYAMEVTLTKERVYRADVNHDDQGDFSFAHVDCDTTPYYGDEVPKGSESNAISFNPEFYGESARCQLRSDRHGQHRHHSNNHL